MLIYQKEKRFYKKKETIPQQTIVLHWSKNTKIKEFKIFRIEILFISFFRGNFHLQIKNYIEQGKNDDRRGVEEIGRISTYPSSLNL